jgi:orotate phosphoribosyltransferase-like protein
MSRGPTIRQEEINKAHELKAQGMKILQICAELKRTRPTVKKMLGLPVVVVQ